VTSKKTLHVILGAVFAHIFRGFVKVFKDFARILPKF